MLIPHLHVRAAGVLHVVRVEGALGGRGRGAVRCGRERDGPAERAHVDRADDPAHGRGERVRVGSGSAGAPLETQRAGT